MGVIARHIQQIQFTHPFRSLHLHDDARLKAQTHPVAIPSSSASSLHFTMLFPAPQAPDAAGEDGKPAPSLLARRVALSLPNLVSQVRTRMTHAPHGCRALGS